MYINIVFIEIYCVGLGVVLITLGKLIGMLFCPLPPLLAILFLKTPKIELAHPVMGTIFLVYMSVSMSVVGHNGYAELRGIKTRMFKSVWGG